MSTDSKPLTTLRRLFRIGWPFWSTHIRVAWGHFLIIVALLLINTKLQVFISQTAGSFMTAIEKRSLTNFDHFLVVYAITLAVAVPVQVSFSYMRTRLALKWRLWKTSGLIKRYYSNRAYYHMIKNQGIDNPAQRLTQDVDTFCNSSIGLGISFLESIIAIYMFSGLLWSISETLTYTVLAYAFVGSLLALSIGYSLSRLAFQQSATEASLRFILDNARRDAVSLALYKTEALAAEQARDGLRQVIGTLMEIMRVNRNLQSFTVGYNLLVPLIPAAICAQIYFKHDMEFGVITQATMAFTAIFHAATIFVAQFNGISNFTANINRLGSFMEALDECERPQVAANTVEVTVGEDIVFEDVTLLAADSTRPLISDLSLTVPAGSGLHICGTGSLIKASIIKAITGLELRGSGKLSTPLPEEIMYLSNDPLHVDSSLRAALTAGLNLESPPNDVKLHKALRLATLGDLAARCGGLDKHQVWKNLLSKGEQQKLALARLLLAAPRYAIIDEATGVLCEHGEERLFTLLRSMDSTVITISNNPATSEFHEQELEVHGDGTWNLRTTKAEAA